MQFSAAVETQVYMRAVGDDVTESVFERFAGERKPDRDRIAVDQGFDGFGGFVEHNFAKSERKACDLRIVGSEVGEQLFRRRAVHGRQRSMKQPCEIELICTPNRSIRDLDRTPIYSVLDISLRMGSLSA